MNKEARDVDKMLEEEQDELLRKYIRSLVEEEMNNVETDEERGFNIHILNLPKSVKRVTLILDEGISKEVT